MKVLAVFMFHYTACKWSTMLLSAGGLSSNRELFQETVQGWQQDMGWHWPGPFQDRTGTCHSSHHGTKCCIPGLLVHQSQIQKGK